MPKQTKTKAPTPVESIKHKDSRKNIPTEELRDFVADDEISPKKVLYPRDQSLDPQLVWKGKDEQDSKPLEVPVLPIYIQEKIHPQALIENLRETAKKGEEEPEFQLFDDFNGIEFEDMIEFYQHDQHWQNRMILGDSLLAMNSLAEKEGLKGQVQMVFIDPPYGINFKSNWQISTAKKEFKESQSEGVSRQPEQIQAFRDTWSDGIHSYLSYLRDRLFVAHQLLSETGSIFVQIGDENSHLVKAVLAEVFGFENYISEIIFVTSTSRTDGHLDSIADRVMWFAKDSARVKYRQLFTGKKIGDGDNIGGSEVETGDLSSQHESEKRSVSYTFRNKDYYPPTGRQWSVDPINGLRRLERADRVHIFSERQIRFIKRAEDYPVTKLNNIWTDTQFGAFQSQKIYVVQTNVRVIERCMLMSSDPGDLVIDPTCGSGTTAYVAEQWGRRWITCDTSRVALTLARTRLISAKYPYYLLSDSKDGQQKEMEMTNSIKSLADSFEQDIHKGFINKRVSHVTQKAIANNDEIDIIYDRYQKDLEPLRASLNKELKQKWEEWDIPREADEKWNAKAKELHEAWWKLRRLRQKEIDDSIAKRADMELLYDQPYEDKKRIRVAGPFTVESLSPHRVLSTTEGEKKGIERSEDRDFVSLILDNLRRAGIQNTKKTERLKFDRLEAMSNPWIHAAGEFTDADGKVKRVAISVGPEHGTVDPMQIKEAAKEAVKGLGFDVLYVLGFAFDPHASEEAKRYGKLQVNITKMNPDLAMSDELLKKTGTGNLFMVFGEPDITITKTKDGKYEAEIKGLDVYDPTTGEVRSNTTDDIACWFIDTNYNSESFFVRHAYFTGGQEPYDKLKRALKAEINEEAWQSLYSTKSRPFDKPTTGKIAVKVINHYGDEVLNVYDVK